ncbi:DNA polymerase III subunit delta [Candidatus Pelagibacter sp.]|nr:DNA polymerase III subunit delta [Candidatus Pelagibacter sp.]
MILKSFEIEKIRIKDKKFFLFYGENQGHKNQIIKEKFESEFKESTYFYEEAEILKNKNEFFNNILSKSFFENEKLIIINRASDKIKDILDELIEKKIEDLVIILNANMLEKKSKIRSLFEKSKDAFCVPFYEDNNQTLSGIVSDYFRNKKIPISQQAINLIVGRARGDRQNIKNELEKIENFISNKKTLEIQDLLKLTNLAENYNVSELVDSCLSKNKKRTVNILNENNYSLEDCILIIRTLLIKAKRLVKLSKEFEKNKNLDTTVSEFKPPIFWKEKDTVKQQIKSWSFKEVKNLVYQINGIELLIKKYSNNSVNILFDFIIEISSPINN